MNTVSAASVSSPVNLGFTACGCLLTTLYYLFTNPLLGLCYHTGAAAGIVQCERELYLNYCNIQGTLGD